MLRTILIAAMSAAVIEIGAQTPPPAPPAPPVTPAVPAVPPSPVTPRPPDVGDRISPRAPRWELDDLRRDSFEHALRTDEVRRAADEARRALEAGRFETRFEAEEMRRLAREATEETRHLIERDREYLEHARRLAQHEREAFMLDRHGDPMHLPTPAALAPLPPLPPLPPDSWSEALRRFESPTPAPRPFEVPPGTRRAPGPEMMPREPWLPQDPADSIYRAARELLSRSNYRSAAETFRLLSQKYPTSGYAPDGMYYEAFALYRIGGQNELRAALDILERQKARFPRHNNPDPGLATRIQGELANRGDRTAAAAVASAASAQGQSCNREEMQVRIEALNALSRMNIDSTTPILRRVLGRRDECSVTLRRQAITLLGKNTDASTTELMIDVMKNDPSIEVRRAALSWLGSTPSERGSAALDEVLRSPKDEALHSSALRALASAQNPRSAQALRTLIERKEVSENIRGEAMTTLTRVDSANAGAYLRSIYPRLESRQLKSRALTAISRMRDAESQKWMLNFVRDTTEPVELRRSALSTLTRATTTTPADVGALYRNVPELELRTQIISSLASRKEPEAVDQLIAIYRATTDPKLQVQIINVLSRRDDPRTQKLLLEILNK